MQELLNQTGVGSCGELQAPAFLQSRTRVMALVMRDFDQQQQPILYDLLMHLFNNPYFFSYFSGNADFNAVLGNALFACADPSNFGNILQVYFGGDFGAFLDLVGENAIIESLLLGNFGDFYNFLISQQMPTDLMNCNTPHSLDH